MTQQAVLRAALILATIGMPLLFSPLKAQTAVKANQPTARTVPRTAWGHPDLQGTWSNTTTTPVERPDDLANKDVLSGEELQKRDAEVAARVSFDRPTQQGNTGAYNEFWMERGRLNNRTSLVIDPPDGKLPALTETGRKRAEALAEARRLRPADSWKDRSAYDRCITRSMPGAMMPGFYNHNYQILQTPGYVAILVEMIHDVRIIPLDGRPHLNGNLRLWLGDSRGRWDGDTLVVDTTNVNDEVFETRTLAFALFGVGQNVRLTERFTRLDADTIDYQFTVDAPTVYTRPWTLSIPMAKISGPIFEYACHEGNYAMPHILAGARAEEKAAEAAAKKR
jgi:hypothetical protein